MSEGLSETDIDYCLLALYRRGGSYRETAEYLKTTYVEANAPDAARLKRWRTGLHRDRYMKIAAANAEDLEKEIVVRLRELATQTGLLQIEALDHLVTQIKAGDVKPSMIKELSIISGVSIDKLLVLSGRPDKIVAIQNPDDIIKRLVEAGYAEVDEVIDATVVEERLLTERAHTDEDERLRTNSPVSSSDGTHERKAPTRKRGPRRS